MSRFVVMIAGGSIMVACLVSENPSDLYGEPDVDDLGDICLSEVSEPGGKTSLTCRSS